MLTDDVRRAAFRLLLGSRAPITAAELADQLGQPTDQVRGALKTLHEQGLLRVNAARQIIGAAGLSIQPDRHQVDLDGHRYWTWCAYDILGIFAALGATGHAYSTTPDTGQAVDVQFRDGTPQPTQLVLFLPDDDPDRCTSAYDQWCPNSNLFHSAEAAQRWAAAHGITGQVLTLTQAAERGGARWRPLTAAT
jgi:alkylmercury lyase